jgi:hypothetical protein
LRIGFDIDGVLANFNPAYIRLLNEIEGKNAPLDYAPQQWNYEADLGFSPETSREAWKRIGQSKHFWRGLAPMGQFSELNEINDENHDIYFITARPGKDVKFQTEQWLEEELNYYRPTVLISALKGVCCYGLDLEVYIDDRLENILDVQGTSPSTRAYLITRSYNVNGNVLRRADSVLDVLRTEGLLSE